MPTRAFLAREQHRVLLTIHALVMISGLLVCALLNRRLSPDRLWVQWVAIGWLAVAITGFRQVEHQSFHFSALVWACLV